VENGGIILTREKLNYMEKTPASVCYFIYLKSHMDFPWIETGPLGHEESY
jgi:hypothetical protein